MHSEPTDAAYWAARLELSQPGLIDPAQDRGRDRALDDIARLERDGPPRDPRPDIDTDSLRQRFPHLAAVKVEEIEFKSPHGTLPARAYHPLTATKKDAALVWIHGGGWVAGDLDGPEANWVSLELAARGVSVIALGYHKALNGRTGQVLSDDVLAGWLFAQQQFAAEGIPPGAVHLGGGSAGAALSAGLSLRLRDEERSSPATVIMVYPMTHSRLPPLGTDILKAVADLPRDELLTPGHLRVLIDQVQGADGLGGRYVFAGEAGKLGDQPPHLIINAQRDPLRASGELYGWQLARSGVHVTTECQSAIAHGHLNHPGDPGALQTVDRMVAWITRHEQLG